MIPRARDQQSNRLDNPGHLGARCDGAVRATGPRKIHDALCLYRPCIDQVNLFRDGQGIIPRGELAVERLPTAEIEQLSVDALRERGREWAFAEIGSSPGTSIRVTGYHQNSKNGLRGVGLLSDAEPPSSVSVVAPACELARQHSGPCTAYGRTACRTDDGE